MSYNQALNQLDKVPFQSARKPLIQAFSQLGFTRLKLAAIEKSLSLPPGALSEDPCKDNNLSTKSVENSVVKK